MIKYVLIIFIFLSLLFFPAQSQALTFTGQGVDITDNFQCNGGLVKFQFTHDGDSNFIVHLVNTQTGDIAAYLINEIGQFSGTVADNPPAGTYLLTIDADGKWEIDITGNTTPPSIPPPSTTETVPEKKGGCFINSLWP